MTQQGYILGAGTTTGTSTAYVLDANSWQLKDKRAVLVEVNVASGSSPTIDIEGTGAFPLYKPDGTAIATNELLPSGQYIILYDADNSRYVVINPQGVPSGIIPLTRAGALALIAGSTVVAGQIYQITDRRNCVLTGSSTKSFGMEGFMTINASEFSNVAEETLDLKYDIVGDEVQSYKDILGNRLNHTLAYGSLTAFLTSVKYGLSTVTDNTYEYGTFSITTSGVVSRNTFRSEMVLANTVSLTDCFWDCTITQTNITGTSLLQNCTVDKPDLSVGAITLASESHNDKRCNQGFSNFEKTFSVTGSTGINMSGYELYGVMILTTSNTIETITSISNLQTNHPVNFVCRTNGKDIRFDCADQEDYATTNDIVSKSLVEYIKGSIVCEDIITIKRDTTEDKNYVLKIVNNDYDRITQRKIERYDDFENVQFFTPPAAWTVSSSGGGGTEATLVPADYGMINQRTGNSINSYTVMAKGGFGIVSGSKGKMGFNFRFRPAFSLSTATDARDRFFGIATENTGVEPSSGLYFRYVFSLNGNFWVAVSANITRTATVTAVAVVINQFYKFRIVVNRSWTVVRYYIDGVLVATHTTNIPSAAINLGPLSSIRKTVSTVPGAGMTQIDGIGLQFYNNAGR